MTPVTEAFRETVRRRPITELFELRVAHRGLVVYRLADRPGEPWARVAPNRIGGRLIGGGVALGHWCASLTWRRP